MVETLESRNLLAVVSVSGASLSFVDGVGETNTVVISESAGTITIVDIATPITAGAGATSVGPNEVTVPTAGLVAINVNLGDMHDSLDMSAVGAVAGLNRTSLFGGDGDDVLVGSDLNDFFNESLGNDSVDGRGAITVDQWSANSDIDMTLTDAGLTTGTDFDTYTNVEVVNLGGLLGDNTIDATAVTTASGITTGINLTGREGNDTLKGGGVKSVFRDSLGTNTFIGGSSDADTVVVNGDFDMALTDSSLTVGTSFSSLSNVEVFDLTAGAGNNVIDASGVTVSGGITRVRILGQGGNDTITGSALDDTITVLAGASVLDGGGGYDILSTSGDFNQTLTNGTLKIGSLTSTHVNFEQASLVGGNGDNLIDASGLDATSGFAFVSIQGLDGNDTLLGSQITDEIRTRGGNNLIDGGSSPINSRDRLVFSEDADMTVSDNTAIIGAGVNSFTNIEDLRLAGNASDNVIDASALTTASGVTLFLASGFGGNDTLVPSSDAAMAQSLDGNGGFDRLDLSNLPFTPIINITGPGSTDGDVGSFTTGGTFSSFNNIDDIVRPPEYDFSNASFTVTEGNSSNTTTVVEVNRSMNTFIASSVNVSLVGVTAVEGDDFTAIVIPVDFLPGEVTKNVPIEILGDNLVERDETVSLSFADGISGTTNPSATLTIADEDNATISINDVSQFETNAGQTAFEFDVTLSAPVDVVVDVRVNTADSSATEANGDYDAITESEISFAPSAANGVQVQTVTVFVNGDTNSESDEFFSVNLSSLVATGRDVTLADGQGIGTILNDDVSNLPPEVLAFTSDATFQEKSFPGDIVSISAFFSDQNPSDSHTAIIVWGDGTSSPGIVNPSTGEITAQHVYQTGGIFEVQVVVDDATLSDSASTTAVVSGARLNSDNTLEVIGTDSNDKVHIRRKRDQIRVWTQTDHQPSFTDLFPLSDVASILVYACNGNDRVHISTNLHLPTLIDVGSGNDVVFGGSGDDIIRGGDGDDHLWGGLGDDVLLGNAGRDWLFGNRGRDLLIGGDGRDFLFGGRGEDILIGGKTIHDSDDEALNAIRDEWNSGSSRAIRTQNLIDGTGDNTGQNLSWFLDANSLQDDNKYDLLHGGWHSDWKPED